MLILCHWLISLHQSAFWRKWKDWSNIIENIPNKNVKLKQSLYKPGQALRVPGGWGSQISRKLAHAGGKVVSPTPPHFPTRKYSWYSFLVQAESIQGPQWRWEGLCQWKIPVKQSGIKSATFRNVAHCLNKLRNRVTPPQKKKEYKELKTRRNCFLIAANN